MLVRALDRILILHADHEQNASTSTVRLAGSSGANPFACIASGIAALWGPAHGGANEAALKMLEEIGDVSRVTEYVQGVKDKKYRLMGFGHRVYKNMDPRASVMRETCYEVLKELKLENNKLFELAMELEQIALERSVFHRAQAVSERGFLFRHRAACAGHPDQYVHGDLCAGAHRGLDLAMERNDGGRRPEDRSSAPAVSRRNTARLCPASQTLK